jgi:hypothetical protein
MEKYIYKQRVRLHITEMRWRLEHLHYYGAQKTTTNSSLRRFGFGSSIDIRIRDPHCTENSIYVFPEMKLRSLGPKSYILVRICEQFIYSQDPSAAK